MESEMNVDLTHLPRMRSDLERLRRSRRDCPKEWRYSTEAGHVRLNELHRASEHELTEGLHCIDLFP